MKEEIKVNLKVEEKGNQVIIDGEVYDKKDIVVEVTDYGDNYFDAMYVNTATEGMAGSAAYCGIPTKSRTMLYAEKMVELAGLEKAAIRIVKGNPDPNGML